MLPTVLCLASSRPQTEQIIDRLQGMGIPVSDISVLLLPTGENAKPAPIRGLSFDHDQQAEKTGSAAATGGVAGAAAGVATTSIVGLTPLLMIAPLVVATGAAFGAATGALASGLSDYGIPASLLDRYEKRLVAGDLLVAVRTDDEARLERARAVLAGEGGQNVEVFRLTKRLG